MCGPVPADADKIPSHRRVLLELAERAPACCVFSVTGSPDYTGSGRKAGGKTPLPVHMHRVELFGRCVFRFRLPEALERGCINPFALEYLPRPVPDDTFAADAVRKAGARREFSESWMREMARSVCQAMRVEGNDRMIIYLSQVADCMRLMDAVMELQASRAKRPAHKRNPGDVFECLVAHSKQPDSLKEGAISRMRDEPAGWRGVLFNVRILVTGVNIPWLNSVFFAVGKKASTEIIQGFARPLTKRDGKAVSKIFIPLLIPRSADTVDPAEFFGGEHGGGSQFAGVVALHRALIDEDPSLLDWVAGDDGAFPVSVSAAAIPAAKGGSLELDARALATMVRRVVAAGSPDSAADGGKSFRQLWTDTRLFTFGNYPWPRIIEQIRATVATGRYPKTSDACMADPTRTHPFSSVFGNVQREYQKFRRGEQSKLEPYQVRELETLPHWETFGADKYPAAMLLDRLEEMLETAAAAKTRGALVPLSIGNGESILFSATVHQRLSGLFRVINQQDSYGSAKMLHGPNNTYRNRRLAEIGKRFGLGRTFRRRTDGPLSPAVLQKGEPGADVETWIQRCNACFSRAWIRAARRPHVRAWFHVHYPGYATQAGNKSEMEDVHAAGTTIPSVVGEGKKKKLRR
jgi:hypothetical protein